MSTELDGVLGEELGPQAWANQELQEFLAYGLATAACQGFLNAATHCQSPLPVTQTWHPCVYAEKREMVEAQGSEKTTVAWMSWHGK